MGTDVTALLDAERILDGEDESQGGVRADAIDLLKELCLGVDALGEPEQFLVQDFDLLVDGIQRGEDWLERSVELTRDLVLDPCVELRCRLVRRASPEGFEDSANMVDH